MLERKRLINSQLSTCAVSRGCSGISRLIGLARYPRYSPAAAAAAAVADIAAADTAAAAAAATAAADTAYAAAANANANAASHTAAAAEIGDTHFKYFCHRSSYYKR